MTKRGRPTFRATAAQKRKVEQYVSAGMSQTDIARAIGCTEPTLQKHFAEELAIGAAKRRAECIDLLYRAARKGNVSAIKKLEEMTKVAALAEAQRNPKPEVPTKLGKKQQAAEAATVAGEGSDWGDDLQVPGPGTPVN